MPEATTYKATGLAELLQGIPAGTKVSDSLAGLVSNGGSITNGRCVVDGAELRDELPAKTPLSLDSEIGDFGLHMN